MDNETRRRLELIAVDSGQAAADRIAALELLAEADAAPADPAPADPAPAEGDAP